VQIKVSVTKANEAQVEVIDPSDGAVAHSATVAQGEQYLVTTTARTPADIEVYGPESTEQAATEEPQDTPSEADTPEPKADTPKPKATSTTTSKSADKDAA
jgi:hypothetical protein